MQPYIFPYIGYFQLINYVDKWVIFYDTQYIAKGWINRNRILHPEINKQWQYFTVPLKKHSRDSNIKDLEINQSIKWQEELFGKLSAYKRKAPYYAATIALVNDCLAFECSTLSQWLEYSLKSVCAYLDIPFNYAVFSKMKINTENVNHPGQWALEIADAMQAGEYVNPHGGFEVFRESDFSARNIKLHFLKPGLTPYVQRRGCFVPGLSIIDIMMWKDKDEINAMLNDFTIVKQAELKLLAL